PAVDLLEVDVGVRDNPVVLAVGPGDVGVQAHRDRVANPSHRSPPRKWCVTAVEFLGEADRTADLLKSLAPDAPVAPATRPTGQARLSPPGGAGLGSGLGPASRPTLPAREQRSPAHDRPNTRPSRTRWRAKRT